MSVEIQALVAITSSLRVLYAEDDVVLRENTVAILSDLFLSIDEAADGVDALNQYSKNPQNYDIVITDLNMPRMNGIELIRQIQLLNPLQAIMIVSAHNETEYFLESIRNSVNSYILKPIDFTQLMEALYKTASTVKERKENIQFKENLQQLVEEQTQKLALSYEKMNEFLTIDQVTKLQNATMLYYYLEHVPQEHALSAMLYKIDDFSFINLTYGFEFADEILKKVGEFLQFNIRDDVKLFKYNSNEFVIIFDPTLIDLESVAVQIQAFFRETSVGEYQDTPIYVTLSCGIASSKDASTLLPKARTALREACLRGIPDQFNIYDSHEGFLQKSQHDTTWIQKFRLAFEEDRIVPYFQPIVDNETSKIISYECLARIEEEGEIITPSYFLEAARKSGLMSNLTRTMINKCFKVFADSEMMFSINITNEDLLSETFIDFLTIKQAHYHIKSHNVTLEILEDIVINECSVMPLKHLQILKKLGYKFALDDFGNDRSNFNRLKQLGVDTLKIDGQFIQGIDKSVRNQHIVDTIARMAKKMNIKVIAEFVSTYEEFQMVKRLGVDYSQGYFFNRPSDTLV